MPAQQGVKLPSPLLANFERLFSAWAPQGVLADENRKQYAGVGRHSHRNWEDRDNTRRQEPPGMHLKDQLMINHQS